MFLRNFPLSAEDERHFSLASTAKIGGAAFLLKATSALTFGKLSDVWISSGSTPTLVRKTFLAPG